VGIGVKVRTGRAATNDIPSPHWASRTLDIKSASLRCGVRTVILNGEQESLRSRTVSPAVGQRDVELMPQVGSLTDDFAYAAHQQQQMVANK